MFGRKRKIAYICHMTHFVKPAFMSAGSFLSLN